MPRAGLSRQAVVEAGYQLVDRVGWPNLTMAALAADLGVRQPSLYKHVEGLPRLQREIAIRAKLDLADAMAWAAVGRSRSDAVRALARAYRDWAHRHPGLYPAVARAAASDDQENADAGARAASIVLEVLAGYDLRGDDAIHATRALRAGLHGFVDLEASGGFGMPVDVGRSFDVLVEGFVRALEGSGQTLEGSGRALEGSGRALEGSGRPLEGSGGALEGSGRPLEGSGRALEGSGRPLEG